MNDTELKALLEGARTIAVVGASANPDKAANHIPEVLLNAGYTMIPVHPTAQEILGQTAYASLAEVPVLIDIVDVFRPSAEAAGIAEQAVAVGAKAVWLQAGITSAEAGEVARQAGVAFVEDLCIGETSKRLNTHPARE
ncbi:MAG: CoA-binding protein [Acidimicrobiia bacterium]|nr:CoA-binding protein [Acidimicrobiia bacterium]MDH5503690.1 CoA-binding protein [Acidimicrobiia bacterium]